MSRRLALLALLAAFPLQVAAEQWTLPRMSYGVPDLQGIWTNATLTPIEFTDAFDDNQIGSFGPSEAVEGAIRLDKTQLAFNVTQLFGPRFGASESLVAFDVAWVHVHGLPKRSDLLLNAPGLTEPVVTAPRDTAGEIRPIAESLFRVHVLPFELTSFRPLGR